MSTSTISIEVDDEMARAFSEASAEDQRKLEILLGLRLRELTMNPTRPIVQIMDEIGTRAQTRGLTPEILDSLLDAE